MSLEPVHSLYHGFARLFRTTMYVLIALIAIAFALSNRQPVALDLFPLNYELATPAFLLIFASFALGMLFGNLSSHSSRSRSRRAARQDKDRIDALEQEAAALSGADATGSALSTNRQPDATTT